MYSRKVINMAISHLQKTAPNQFERIKSLEKPDLIDVNMIPLVLNMLNNTDNYAEDLVFKMAVIYRLFFPYKLEYPGIKLDAGVRFKIRDAFGFTHGETVNYYYDFVAPAMKGYRYRQRVEDEANRILIILKSK